MTVKFDTTVHPELPWSLGPMENKVRVRVGEARVVNFVAENRSGQEVTGQAIPSIAPWKASGFFSKIECFCFTRQTLAANERKEMPVRFVVSYREANSGSLDSIAWVTQVLDQEKATGIGSYITVRSYQYSADIVCLSGNGRAYKRYRAILDTQAGSPRVVYWRSLTHFGWPLQPEIVAALKKGQPLTSVVLSMH